MMFIFYAIMAVITLFSLLTWLHYEEEPVGPDTMGGIIACSVFWPITYLLAIGFGIVTIFNMAAKRAAARIKKNRK